MCGLPKKAILSSNFNINAIFNSMRQNARDARRLFGVRHDVLLFEVVFIDFFRRECDRVDIRAREQACAIDGSDNLRAVVAVEYGISVLVDFNFVILHMGVEHVLV